jgi:hypothetical protein
MYDTSPEVVPACGGRLADDLPPTRSRNWWARYTGRMVPAFGGRHAQR